MEICSGRRQCGGSVEHWPWKCCTEPDNCSPALTGSWAPYMCLHSQIQMLENKNTENISGSPRRQYVFSLHQRSNHDLQPGFHDPLPVRVHLQAGQLLRLQPDRQLLGGHRREVDILPTWCHYHQAWQVRSNLFLEKNIIYLNHLFADISWLPVVCVKRGR